MANQIFFLFIPKLGEDASNLTIIFVQMGWFNHQLVGHYFGEVSTIFFNKQFSLHVFFLVSKVKLLTSVVAFSDFRFVEFALRGVFCFGIPS